MLKVSAENGDYLLLTKRIYTGPAFKCDAAYGEALERERMLEEFTEIFYRKQPMGKAPPDVWIAEKYILVPVRINTGVVQSFLIGAGTLLGASTVMDILKIRELLKKMGSGDTLKKMTRRAFVKGMASGACLLGAYKFESIKNVLEKLEAKKEMKSVPYGAVSSAMTAIILEKEVAPSVNKSMGRRPVICVAVDKDKTGVDAEELGKYLQDMRAAKELILAYGKYLETFGLSEEDLVAVHKQNLHFRNHTT